MSRIDAKIVLLGKSYAGKTCLVNRYCHSRFDSTLPYQNTIGAAFGSKRETVGKQSIMMGIWDTAGHERYESMTRMYYRGAAASTRDGRKVVGLFVLLSPHLQLYKHIIYLRNLHPFANNVDTAGHERYESMTRMYYRGAAASILCYDITDKSSFDRVRFWAGELRATESGCKIYLVGTKKDIVDDHPNKREVTKDMAEPLAEDFHSELFETSAKTGENIEELFKRIASDLIQKKEREKLEHQELQDGINLSTTNTSLRSKLCSFCSS